MRSRENPHDLRSFRDTKYQQRRSFNQPFPKEHQMIREKLQRMSLTTIDLDEAVERKMEAKLLRTAYEESQLGSPIWLDDAIRALERHIADRVRDTLEMELRDLEAQDAVDMTPTERRAKRAERKSAIEARLHGKKAEQPA